MKALRKLRKPTFIPDSRKVLKLLKTQENTIKETIAIAMLGQQCEFAIKNCFLYQPECHCYFLECVDKLNGLKALDVTLIESEII